MENLAGKPSEYANTIVRYELLAADIDEEWSEPSVEVFATLGGRIGSFRLYRLWYYWAVRGLVPLAAADEMYAHPDGRRDVRIGGHCECPAPRDGASLWLAPDGREVLDRANEREARMYAGGPSELMSGIGAGVLARCLFADVPAEYPDVQGYVKGYHIDTAAGLRLFREVAGRHGLDGKPPPAHARVALWERDRESRRRTLREAPV